MKIRVGFGLGNRQAFVAAGGAGPAGGDAAQYRLLVDELERLRFDSLWISERVRSAGPDPVVAMSIAVARTDRLKVGMSVMVLPGRNPVLVAKELASLDVLSGGRLLPAFGLGVADSAEHQAFGVERSERAALFDEALTLIRRLWTEDDVSHHGARFHLDGVTVRPKPLQQPLDVWMGGVAPSELRRVGRLADGWLPSFVTPDDVAAGAAVVREVAAAHDREIDPEHYGVLIPYAPGDVDDTVLVALASRRPGATPDDILARSPEALPDLIERYVAVGASKFVVVPIGPINDVTAELERLAAIVRPLET